MAIERLTFGKDWTRAEDFPTYEDSEQQVREDLQYHPDAVKTYLNEVLLPLLESGEGAASLGSTYGTVQEVLDRHKSDIETLASGGVPSVSQCVAVPFTAQDWTAPAEDGGDYVLTVGRETHKRYGAAFGYGLWHDVDGTLMSNTWGVAGTQVSVLSDSGEIALRSREPYAGAVVFFGV